jgi:hypothetical protein
LAIFKVDEKRFLQIAALDKGCSRGWPIDVRTIRPEPVADNAVMFLALPISLNVLSGFRRRQTASIVPRFSHDTTHREASDDRHRDILSNLWLLTGRPRRHRAAAGHVLFASGDAWCAGACYPGAGHQDLGTTLHVSGLLRGRIDLFRTGSLIDMLARLGVRVRFVLKPVRGRVA